jgi:hypothetical protein
MRAIPVEELSRGPRCTIPCHCASDRAKAAREASGPELAPDIWRADAAFGNSQRHVLPMIVQKGRTTRPRSALRKRTRAGEFANDPLSDVHGKADVLERLAKAPTTPSSPRTWTAGMAERAGSALDGAPPREHRR